MSDSIVTHSVGRGFVVSDDIVLCQSSRTRTIFRPGIHGKGVRGHIIRQKIGDNGEWLDANDVNFNCVPADSGVKIELDTAATRTLFNQLGNLYKVQQSQGAEYGEHRYVVAEESEVIIVNDQNKARVIQELLVQNASEELWKEIEIRDPDLTSRLAAGRIQYEREAIITQFETALSEHSDEEAYWQQFFKDNPWILQSIFSSAVYLLGSDIYIGGKGPVGRQGVGGVATDFLFSDESTKSFSVVEIKTPATHLVGLQYRGTHQDGHSNETYSMHAELSGGIVQTRNQISVAIENFEGVLGPGFEHRLNRVHPKGVLIIGSLDGLNDRQMASFNHFRHGLYSLTVITYDELLKRLKLLYFQNRVEEQVSSTNVVVEASTPTTIDDFPF